MIKDSTSVRVAKNTGYLYVKLLVSLCFTLYTTRIVLDALGASDFGIFGVLGSLIAMLGFLNSSMAATTQRFMNYYEGKDNAQDKIRIFNSAVLMHIAIAVFVGVLFSLFEDLMLNFLIKVDAERIIAAKWVFRITVFSTMISIVTVPYEAAINSHEDMLFYSVVGIIDIILKFLLALYVTITSYDKLIVYGITVLAVTILTFVMMWVYCRRKYSECVFDPQKHVDKGLIREMFMFGGWSLVGTSSTMISNYGLGVVINRFFGTIINATFGVCNQFTGFLLVLSTNLMKAVNPVIVKNEGKGERGKMFNATFFSCKLSYLAYAFIGIPFFVECNFLLNLWLKDVPPYCLEFCRLSCVLKVIEQLTVPLHTSITAVGNIKQYNIITAIIQLCQLLLAVLFFSLGLEPHYCVIAMIVAVIMVSIYRIFFCVAKLSMIFSSFANIVLRSFIHLVMAMSVWLFVLVLHDSFARFLIVTFISILLNTVLGYYIIFDNQERVVVNGVCLKFLNSIQLHIAKLSN